MWLDSEFAQNAILIAFVALIVSIIFLYFYAAFGKPKTPPGQSRKSEIDNGFRRAGWVMLAIGVVITLFIGLSPFFQDPAPTTPRGSLYAPLICLVVSCVLVVICVDGVAKVLPGILGYGIFGAASAYFSGHLSGRPQHPVSKQFAAMYIGCALFAFALLLPYQKRKLYWTDRIAVVGFTYLTAFGILADVKHRPLQEVVAFASAATLLAAANIIDLIQRRSGARKRTDYLNVF